jgi:hypothetical protein
MPTRRRKAIALSTPIKIVAGSVKGPLARTVVLAESVVFSETIGCCVEAALVETPVFEFKV